MKLQEAQPIAQRVKEILTPYSDRIEIAGSIRRRKPEVHDIDIVLIENPDAALTMNLALHSLGIIKANGPELKRLLLHDHNINVDIYIATPQTWYTTLLIRTGSKQNNITLCTLARKKGWHLAASGEGLFDQAGHRIAGDTEQSIYQALGIPYQHPQERDALPTHIRS